MSLINGIFNYFFFSFTSNSFFKGFGYFSMENLMLIRE